MGLGCAFTRLLFCNEGVLARGFCAGEPDLTLAGAFTGAVERTPVFRVFPPVLRPLLARVMVPLFCGLRVLLLLGFAEGLAARVALVSARRVTSYSLLLTAKVRCSKERPGCCLS